MYTCAAPTWPKGSAEKNSPPVEICKRARLDESMADQSEQESRCDVPKLLCYGKWLEDYNYAACRVLIGARFDLSSTKY